MSWFRLCIIYLRRDLEEEDLLRGMKNHFSRSSKRSKLQGKTISDLSLKRFPDGVKSNDVKSNDVTPSEERMSCAAAQTTVKINGDVMTDLKEMSASGHIVVALNTRGRTIMTKHYATNNDSKSFMNMINDLKKLPDDSVLIIATQVRASICLLS